MAIVVTCKRVVEPCKIYYRVWSRVVAIVVTCQRVRICRLKLGWDVRWSGMALYLVDLEEARKHLRL